MPPPFPCRAIFNREEQRHFFPPTTVVPAPAAREWQAVCWGFPAVESIPIGDPCWSTPLSVAPSPGPVVQKKNRQFRFLSMKYFVLRKHSIPARLACPAQQLQVVIFREPLSSAAKGGQHSSSWFSLLFLVVSSPHRSRHRPLLEAPPFLSSSSSRRIFSSSLSSRLSMAAFRHVRTVRLSSNQGRCSVSRTNAATSVQS